MYCPDNIYLGFPFLTPSDLGWPMPAIVRQAVACCWGASLLVQRKLFCLSCAVGALCNGLSKAKVGFL